MRIASLYDIHGNLPEWTAQQLGAAEERLIASWPGAISVDAGALGSVLFCHATPQSDTGIFTRAISDEKLIPVFSGVVAQIVVCGHTHMQFDRMLGKDACNQPGKRGHALWRRGRLLAVARRGAGAAPISV